MRGELREGAGGAGSYSCSANIGSGRSARPLLSYQQSPRIVVVVADGLLTCCCKENMGVDVCLLRTYYVQRQNSVISLQEESRVREKL